MIRKGDVVVTRTSITPDDIRRYPPPPGTVMVVMEVWYARNGERTYRLFWSGGVSRYPVGEWAIKKLEAE